MSDLNQQAKMKALKAIWPEFDNIPVTYNDTPSHWKQTVFNVHGHPFHMCAIPPNPNRSFKGTIIYIAGLDSKPYDNIILNEFLADEGYAVFEFDIAHPRETNKFVELSSEMVRSVVTSQSHPAANFIQQQNGPIFLLTHSTGGMLSTEKYLNPLLRSKLENRFGAGVVHLCCFFNSPATRPKTIKNFIYRDWYIQKNADALFGRLWFDIAYGLLNKAKGERATPNADANGIKHGELETLFQHADQVRDKALHATPYHPDTSIPITYAGAKQDPSADNSMIKKVAVAQGYNYKEMKGWHRPVEDPRYPENKNILLNILNEHTAQWREQRVRRPSHSWRSSVPRNQAA